MNMKKGSIVTVEYKLTYDSVEGELIEETSDKEPLEFTFGQQEMIPAFEEKLANLKSGDTFEFKLLPEEAYGIYQDELLAEYPKTEFMVEGEIDEDFLQPGELIEMKDDEENVFEGIIEENKINSVVIDFNHPLSGEVLYFKGKVLAIS